MATPKGVKGDLVDISSTYGVTPGSAYSKRIPTAKEMLQQVSINLAPFVPFSARFAVEVTQRANATVFGPSGGTPDDSYDSAKRTYEEITEDPESPSRTDLLRTRDEFASARGAELKSGANQLAQLFRDATLFAHKKSEFKQAANPLYAHEIAFDAVATDIFDKLKQSDKNKGTTFLSEMEELTGTEAFQAHNNTTFDVGANSVKEHQKLGVHLLALKHSMMNSDPKIPEEEIIATLRNIAGTEITSAGSKTGGKRIQHMFKRITNNGASAHDAWEGAVKEFLDELNSGLDTLKTQINGFKDDIFKYGEEANRKARESSKMVLRDAGFDKWVITEINQAVSRAQDITFNNSVGNLAKTGYLYEVPINMEGPPGVNAMGQAIINITGVNTPDMQFEIANNGIRLQVGDFGMQESGINMIAQLAGALELGTANAINDLYAELIAGMVPEHVMGIYSNTVNAQAADPEQLVAAGIAPYATAVQIMGSKEIVRNIESAMSQVQEPMTQEAKAFVESMMFKANMFSQVWKDFTANNIFLQGREAMTFSNPGVTGPEPRVWSEDFKHWNDTAGMGLTVAPFVAAFKDGYNDEQTLKTLGLIGK